MTEEVFWAKLQDPIKFNVKEMAKELCEENIDCGVFSKHLNKLFESVHKKVSEKELYKRLDKINGKMGKIEPLIADSRHELYYEVDGNTLFVECDIISI